jgi:hypothetical protein
MTGTNIIGLASVLDTLDYEPIGEVKYTVGTNVEYAIYVEYGTASQAAQPYLRPAVERAVRDLDKYAEEADSAEELVEKLALRIESEAKDEAPVDTGNLRASIEAEKVR